MTTGSVVVACNALATSATGGKIASTRSRGSGCAPDSWTIRAMNGSPVRPRAGFTF